MSKAEVKLRYNEVGAALLRSAEAEAICMEIAQRAVSSLGDGYKAEMRTYQKRHGAAVYAETIEAKRENMKNNTILKAVKA